MFGHWELCLLTCRLFFFQAEDGIRDWSVTGVQTCALPILHADEDRQGVLTTPSDVGLVLPEGAKDSDRGERGVVVRREEARRDRQPAGEAPENVGSEPVGGDRHDDRCAGSGLAEEPSQGDRDDAQRQECQEGGEGPAGHVDSPGDSMVGLMGGVLSPAPGVYAGRFRPVNRNILTLQGISPYDRLMAPTRLDGIPAIRSMTGFGRAEGGGDGMTVTV